MKFLLALVMAALVSLVYAEEVEGRSKRSSRMDRMPLHYGKRIPARSLRSILDRMSAGYGKRSSLLPISSALMPVEDFAAIVSSNPRLVQKLVEMYIDTDKDGVVSAEELYRGQRRQ